MTDEVDSKRAVAETKGEAKPSPADGSAPDDLDTLLNEFEQGTKDQKVEQPTTDKPGETKPPNTEEIVRQVRSQIQAEQQFEKDMSQAIKIVKGDLPVKDRAVRGWIEAYAMENESFKNAFLKRGQNPANFNKILEKLKPLYAEDVGADIDKGATETHEAVVAAVRSASKSAPEQKEEFNEAEVRNMTTGQMFDKFPDLKKGF